MIQEEITVALNEDSVRNVLYMTIGISGSGKSTYINKNFKKEIVVCPDEIRRELTGNISDQSKDSEVWTVTTSRISECLNKYGEALLDATNVTSKYRQQFLDKFPFTTKIAIVFNTSPEISKNRIKTDVDSGVDRSEVPSDVIDNQYRNFNDGYSDIEKQFDKVIFANKSK
jgi:predicted kinase